MGDEWNFPFRDMTRRKFQTGQVTLGLAICVSLTVFLVSFGENFGVKLVSPINSGITFGFSYILSGFIFIVVVLNILSGLASAYCLISLDVTQRIRDIGIMRAVGCLSGAIYSYFGLQLMVIVLASCLLGAVGGVFLGFFSLGVMNYLGFTVEVLPPNLFHVLLISLLFFFLYFMLGLRCIAGAVEIEPVKALSPVCIWKTSSHHSTKISFFSGRNLSAKISLRNLVTMKSITTKTLISITLVICLSTFTIAGSMIVDQTTQTYLEKAIGKDVFLVAEKEMADCYLTFLESFSTAEEYSAEELNYFSEQYVISDSLITTLEDIEGVERADPRLLLETIVHELPAIEVDSDNFQNPYTIIGDNRSRRALIMGVHPKKLVNTWFMTGHNIENSKEILIGDSLASILFQNPFKQSLKAFNMELQISGICIDPLNNGEVVYITFDSLASETENPKYNILFLKLSTQEHGKVLKQIEDRISETNFTVVDLNNLIHKSQGYLHHLWSIILFFSLLSFISAVLSISSYLSLSVSSQQRDFNIMRALGIKKRTISKIVFLEILLLILVGSLIGLPTGLFMSLNFLIPDPKISNTTISTLIIVPLILLSILGLSGLISTRKITKSSAVIN